MIALAACIAASTVISLVFKWFARYGVRNLPAIVVNYFVCVICGSLFEGRFPLTGATFGEAWLPLAGVLGFVFIGGFNLNAASVQRAGVAVTSVVQRISLVLSVAFAVAYYGEHIGPVQAAGIGFGLLAVPLVVGVDALRGRSPANVARGSGGRPAGTRAWLLPLGVFAVAGAIESLLTVAQRSYGVGDDTAFTVGLFAWAGTIGLVVHLWRRDRALPAFTARDIVGGVALGIPNFFSIHLILVALGEGLSATTVFPVLNVTTIALSALAGLLVFGERLSARQWTGVGLAALAVILLTRGE